MTLAGILGSSFLIGLSGAMAPGPVLAYTISSSSQRGFWAGPLVVLGHAILETPLFLLLLIGLGRFLSHPLFSGIVALAGAGILIAMGGEMIRESRTARLDLEPGEKGPRLHPVSAGIFISLSNPYWIIWWATIGLNYINISRPYGTPGLIAFFTAHLGADLAWFSLVSAAVAYGRKFISTSLYRWVIRICALAVAGFGMYFGVCGFRTIFL